MIVLGASCDSLPDSQPSILEQLPQIEEFSISPQRVVYDLLSESFIDGDNVNISLSLAATIQTSESQVDLVAYAILSPDSTREPLYSGVLTLTQNNRYVAQVNITLNAFDVQTYPVIVYVIDDNNRLGGEARTALEYRRSFDPGSPPVIENLMIPDRIQRPASGEPARALVFIAEVSDPDGLTNVGLVEFWNIATPTRRILLCDDGGKHPCGSSENSGDVETGDGLYTRRVFIDHSNSLGVNTFTFEAIDLAGLRSEKINYTVEIFE